MPRETASAVWLARPMRCMPEATEGGVSIWITRSTAPMSMPSSSDEVATRAGRRPALSASSMRRRSSRAIDPWWARAMFPPPSSLRAAAIRSARRRLLTKTMVERWARTSSSRRGWMAGQMERRWARATGPQVVVARSPPASRPSSTGPRPGPRPAGRRPCARRRRRWSRGGAWANALPWLRPGSARPRARGRAVAERPMRCRPLPVRASEPLEREGEVGAALGPHEGVDLVHDHGVDGGEAGPRLRGEEQEERFGSGDEDVGRVAGHLRPLVRRGVAGADAHRQGSDRRRPGGPRSARCPRAAPGGFVPRPRPGPAGARCRGPARGVSGAGARTSADRGRRRRRRGSCRSPWGRRRAWTRPGRWAASPGPGRGWGGRRSGRTTPRPRDGTGRGRRRGS